MKYADLGLGKSGVPHTPYKSLSSMNIRWIVRASLVASTLLAGCSGDRSTSTASTPAALDKTEATYALRGVVRKVDPAAHEVILKHEAVPGYMPAMTMPFTVKEGAWPEGLKPGDEVAGTLRVAGDDSEVVELRITRRAPEADPEPVLKVTPALQPGQEVPDFAMTTQEGETLRLSDLRGKVVVLTFVYTRCPLPDACPLMDRKFRDLADAVKALPGWADRVRLLSISFDPEHDTPEVLARHARLKGAKPPLWTFAVASHDELRKAAGPLGLVYAPTRSEVIHTLSTSIIGPDGRLARRETGLKEGRDWTTAEFLQTMKPLLPPSRK